MPANSAIVGIDGCPHCGAAGRLHLEGFFVSHNVAALTPPALEYRLYGQWQKLNERFLPAWSKLNSFAMRISYRNLGKMMGRDWPW